MEQDNLQFAQKVKRVKRNILRTLMIMLPTLTIACIVLGIQCVRLARQATQAQTDQTVLKQKADLLESFQLDNDRLQQLLEDAQTPIPAGEDGVAQGASFEYQTLYPELYVTPGESSAPTEKTIYLTFDDGPSGNTTALLDILDNYNVKATFFVVGAQIRGRENILLDIAQRGHTIGMHSDSHKYNDIYSSVDAFLQDYETLSHRIEEITGQRPSIFRFPGGSINGYSASLYQPLIAEMIRRGYTYYDWNVSAEDATSEERTATDIYNSVVNTVGKHQYSIVLMHDSSLRESSALAVNQIIPALQAQGYQFEALDNTVSPIIFAYK